MPSARQQRIVPIVKKPRQAVRIAGRPKALLSWAIKGIVIAVTRRYAVPIQMPWVVFNLRSVAIA
jgi:hypothetical protein